MKTQLLTLLLATTASFGATAEHRGIWLHPEQFKTPQLASEWISKIAAAHLNTIYPLIWYRGGTAWFQSDLSPMAADVPEGFDPLGNLVKLAHARGIAVHAWFVNGSYGAPATNGVFARHPDWQLQTGRNSETWYDLGQPAVRKFEHDVMLDCLRHYDVDGLHFDYIRYAGHVMCYCGHCQNEFGKKYGFRPLRPGAERFPAMFDVAANPLGAPTTAQVLATFDHGVPAISLNRLGDGEVALVNWQAARSGHSAADDFVKRTLARFGADAKKAFQLNTTQTAAKYRREEQAIASDWLRGLGFPAKLIDETALAKVPRDATLVLYGQYYLAGETATWLESFVRGGGHCLFIDGPVFAIKLAPVQRVLGLKSSAGYFHRATFVSPAPGQDVLKPGPPVDVEKERQRMDQWVEYRRGTVTELVRSVYRSAKALKPRAWINAAVFYNKQAADGVCQDWYGWLREGCMDYVLPMAYTEKNEDLAKAFAEWRAFDPQMERIIPGLSIYSRREGKAVPRDLALVRSQLEMCRDNVTHGNLFFSLAYLNDELIRLLSTGPYAASATPWYPKRR
jgi:uncharacterized lipoprotein YddW (UPF0748 family)